MQTASIEVKVSEDGEVEFSVKCSAPWKNEEAMDTALAMIGAYWESEGADSKEVIAETRVYLESGKPIGEA